MTPEDRLSHRLQEDIVWRIRELSEIVRASQDGAQLRRLAIARAAVPIIYAHWEGYFVVAANTYLNFLTEKRAQLSTLRDEFWVLAMRRRFSPQQILGDQQFGKLLLQIRNDPDRLFKKGSYERINGKSNLSSRVLINCCRSVGLDPSIFSDFLTFIDSDLLDKRNYVAHGESLRIEAGDIPEYRDKVVDLMRVTQNGFENAAVTKSYLRQAPLPLSLQVGSN